VIAGATADIAFKFLPHGLLVQLAAVPLDHVDGRHDHAGGAKPALQTMVLAEGGLYRMQFATGGQAFDRQDFRTVRLGSQHRAGFNRLAIHVHHACTALGRVASDMGTGQPEIFTDELDQKSPVLTLAGNGASVHGHRYIRHKIPPWGVQSSLTLLASFSFFEKGSTSKLGIMFTKATPDGWGEPT
jgi:hypothetical protein